MRNYPLSESEWNVENQPSSVRTYAVIVCAMTVAACGSADRTAPGLAVRDSAGITIVENRDNGAWDEGGAWRLSAEPSVDIGVASGPSEDRLFQAWDAAQLRDGRIVVVNGGTNELRFYDRTGEHLFTAGREGEGPGEFRDLQAVLLFGADSLLANDFIAQRLSVLTHDGAFVRSFRIESPEGGQLFTQGMFRDGSLLVTNSPRRIAEGGGSGVVRDSVQYFRYSLTGARVNTVGRFPFVEFYRLVLGDDDWTLTSPPFPRAPRTTVSQERFYFGTSDRWEIGSYSQRGTLERLIRLERGNRPVTAEDRERYKAERRERARREGSRAVMVAERMLAAVPFPETMPAYGNFVVDVEGNVWVEHYRTPWEEHSHWTIFGPLGRFLGTMEMPDRFAVFQIGSDFVLGRWTDELDVEHVQLYSLIKPRTGADA